MLINEILLKDGVEYNRSKALSADEFKAMIPQLQLALAKTEQGHVIYRGSPNPNPIVYSDPTSVERVSRNTSNELTLLMSYVLPSWSSWPKRSRSLVCSNHFSTSSSYSKNQGAYIVLPLDNPDIAIVPSGDIWDAFKMYPPDFNKNFDEIFRTFRLIVPQVKWPAKIETPEQMVQVLKAYDSIMKQNPDVLEKLRDEISGTRQYGIATLLDLLTSGDAIGAIDRYMGPSSSGFEKIKYSDYTKTGNNNEIWFSGPAVLIRDEAFQKLMN